MDDRGPEEGLTQQQLAELIEKLEQGSSPVAGFTTREYCEAQGIDMTRDSRQYRRALEQLRKLVLSNVIKPVKLKRYNILNGRTVTMDGFAIVPE